MKNKILNTMLYISLFASFIIIVSLWISYFQPNNISSKTIQLSNPEVPLANHIYDSQDNAIIIQKNTEEQQLKFQNIQTGKQYTLTYDGATEFIDKYDQQLAISQVLPGMITTIHFYKENKRLVSLTENNDCFHISNLKKYKLDTKDNTLTYQDTVYKMNRDLVIVSENKEIDLFDLQEIDEISIWGFQDQIYSIQVEKGHSYLRLQNETYFVDGWIEIGQNIIKKVTEDMLLVVPEGRNTVSISHKGNNAIQTIDFPRNEEIAWDLGNVEISLPKTGNIIFTITPENAIVKIDGEKKEHTEPIELSYGIHQISITADEYESLSKYIKVNAPLANISVDLERTPSQKYPEKNTDKAEGNNETNSQTSNTTQTENNQEEKTKQESEEKTKTTEQTADTDTIQTSSTTYKVYIDSPENVEVYVDGNYIGITPISFPKKSGNYIITLRKDGCQTRSYTLQIDDEEKDVNYSFSELLKK